MLVTGCGLPSYVWYQDMADFADGNSDERAGRAGVFRRAGEQDLRAGVRRHPVAHVRAELAEVLVGQHQGQPVAAGLGEHVVQRMRQGQEVLALIQEHRRVAAGGPPGPGPVGGGLPDDVSDFWNPQGSRAVTPVPSIRWSDGSEGWHE